MTDVFDPPIMAKAHPAATVCDVSQEEHEARHLNQTCVRPPITLIGADLERLAQPKWRWPRERRWTAFRRWLRWQRLLWGGWS